MNKSIDNSIKQKLLGIVLSKNLRLHREDLGDDVGKILWGPEFDSNSDRKKREEFERDSLSTGV